MAGERPAPAGPESAAGEEISAAGAAGRRFALLAEVGRELAASLDARQMLARLAELMVPDLADYCIVDVFDEAGSVERAAVAHRDPAGRELVNELQRRYPPSVGAATGMGLVLRTGEPVWAPEVSEEQIRAAAQDEEHLRLLLRLGPKSSILVPLFSHGRVLGALALAITQGDRRYSREDLALAEELGQRAALALDNARLYQTAMAEIAERRRLEAELRQRVEELAAADRRKDEFLAMLAHELRNPLAAISHAGYVLDRKGAGDPRTSELLAMIGRQIRHLSRLVDDLLDVSRFSRGRIELRTGPVELRRAVEGAVEAARPLVEQRRHTLAVSLPAEPLWIEADLTRIEQVLANLLHNAAKFTAPGGRIDLTAERQGCEAVLRVRDDGAGIAPDLLPHVFDLFVQEDRSLARSQGGLGIGLTLARALVERHGGAIAAASEGPGRGSEFTVRLPLLADFDAGAGAGLGSAREEEMGPAPAYPSGSRVLLVEDNLDAAEALCELLRLWGHEVEVAHDGISAL
ncbi:MAG TPA: ATP-binding protein, partial [Thermoanaerobaculia bacterium]